jgi:two-component system chemotaxis response regulator CheY
MKVKILLADDSEFVRNIFGDALKFAGYEVIEAQDGQEAIEKSLMYDISLFVIDINMPRMDGYTLIRKLRMTEKYSNTPIIIISTEHDEKDVRMGLEAGANLYLKKPVAPKSLINDVESFLRSSSSTHGD